jgi:hypothetical protein
LRTFASSAKINPRLANGEPGIFFAWVQNNTINASTPKSTNAMTPARKQAIIWARV